MRYWKWIVVLVAATIGASTAVGFAASLNVGSWHLWGGSQTLTKGTCTVTAAAAITDTYVRESSPTTASGSLSTAIIRADSGQREWMFIRFDISSCALPQTGGADTATMKLVVKNAANNNRTLTVTPVLTSWDGTLTWNQAQALSYGSAATTTFTTGTTNGATLSVPVTVDIDALIKNPSASYGWRIVDNGSTSSANTTTFNSVEASAGSRPQLVINYET